MSADISVIDNLAELIEEVSEAKDDRELFKNLEDVLKKLTYSDFSTLFIFDTKKNILYTEKTKHIELSMLEVEGCLGKVFLKKEPAIHNYIASDKDYIPSYDNSFNHKLKSQMLMPIIDNDKLVGIVRVSRGIKGNLNRYTKRDLGLLLSIESYLIKIIRTIHSNAKLPSSKKSAKIIHNKMVHLKENKNTLDSKDMLLFLSNTVHDIRTPANSLFGFLELLEEKIEDKRLKEFVMNAKTSASFINTLTDSILAITKNKYEGAMSKPQVVNSVKFIADITNIFTSKMTEKNIDYFVLICPELPKEIKIDTLKFKRILINLIGNAYKFTPKNNRIDVFISYDMHTKRITVSVKDEGIGIEEEAQKTLFDTFTQAHDDISMQYGGSGLGLSISADYVSDLGGRLEVKSRIDEGSEFYFTIPLNVIDATVSYDKFHDFEKKIVILTDNLECRNACYISYYIHKLGMPKDRIFLSNKVEKGTTHLICFEHKISDDILSLAKDKNIKVLFIEEKLFSLLNNAQVNQFNIASENTYYGDAIHETIYSGKKMKILIVDDNKINVNLLSSMLETEYVDVTSCMDSQKALSYLKNVSSLEKAFDIIYLDKHMPVMSGTEVLKEFRAYEARNHLKPIYAVSISGDPDIDKEEKELFNGFVNKPFHKQEVREVIQSVKNS